MRRLLVVVAMLLVPALPAWSDGKGAGSVNWQGQLVRASGAGAPDVRASSPAQARLGAERAAMVNALRNLLEQVKGVAVDGHRQLGELMEQDEVRAKVEGVVKGCRIASRRYFSDNGVELEVEVPFAALSDVVDPESTQVAPVGLREGERVATGLVIDARGLKATPALLPRVLDEAGNALYSVDSLSPEARKRAGVASYVQSLEDANKSQKAGEKPLVLRAAKATGADLLLRAEDAKKLASVNTSFLADGRVVIVLN